MVLNSYDGIIDLDSKRYKYSCFINWTMENNSSQYLTSLGQIMEAEE